ncbi:MAG: hypothetical protein LKE53_06460 [Oscillospiraceae bacterium]|jgi:hypothetical protein|nr:hypothetical protein [Oscillospiraceae bacterium]
MNQDDFSTAILSDPAAKKALEKMVLKQKRKAARRRKVSSHKKESVFSVNSNTDSTTEERVIVSADIPADVSPRKAASLKRKAAKLAHQQERKESRLVQKTYFDETEIRSVVRNQSKPGFGHFLLSDGSRMEVIAPRGSCLYNCGESEIGMTENQFMQCLRDCDVQDIKIVGINTPMNTKFYQDELQYYLQNTDNTEYKALLQECIDQLTMLDEAHYDRKIYIEIYARSVESLQKAKAIFHARPVSAYDLMIDQQTSILHKLNNP